MRNSFKIVLLAAVNSHFVVEIVNIPGEGNMSNSYINTSSEEALTFYKDELEVVGLPYCPYRSPTTISEHCHNFIKKNRLKTLP